MFARFKSIAQGWDDRIVSGGVSGWVLGSYSGTAPEECQGGMSSICSEDYVQIDRFFIKVKSLSGLDMIHV